MKCPSRKVQNLWFKLAWIPCWTRYFQKSNSRKESKAKHVSPDNSTRSVRIVHLFYLSRIPVYRVLYLLFLASSILIQITQELRNQCRPINVKEMSLFITSHTRVLDFFFVKYDNYRDVLHLASTTCPVITALLFFVVIKEWIYFRFFLNREFKHWMCICHNLCQKILI